MARGQIHNETAGTRAGHMLAVAFALLVCLLLPGTAAAQYHSSITFENGAGEAALVKLVGPSERAVSVPKNENRTESSIAPGTYYIVVRYGDEENNYSYMKGDPFVVEESGNEYSEVSITLYRVADGNYGTRRASKDEFDRAKS